MLPTTLALIDDDQDYAQSLAVHLRALGIDVSVFGDSNQLLASHDAFDFAFYVVDLMLPGVAGEELVKILRLRTAASVLVVSGKVSPDVFERVLGAGADMYLAKPVQFEQVTLAIRAVQRRATPAAPASSAWRLERRSAQLIAPDGARIELSAADVLVLECFAEANGEVVPREVLVKCLGRQPEPASGDGLNATIFRLRRRIERATSLTVPLQTKARVGYVFKAPLRAS